MMTMIIITIMMIIIIIIIIRVPSGRAAPLGSRRTTPNSRTNIMDMDLDLDMANVRTNIMDLGLDLDMANVRTNSKNLDMANLCTNIMDFRGLDSSRILCLRGGLPRPIGNFPEDLSQAILVGVMLVGQLAVLGGSTRAYHTVSSHHYTLLTYEVH